MLVIETQYDGGKSDKKECDLCSEEPENNILIEKPKSMIIEGRVIVSVRKLPLYICVDCLLVEIEEN